MGEEVKKQAVVHRNLAVLETDDPAILDRLVSDPRVRPYLWLRVGRTRALIAAERILALSRALEEAGYPPHYSRNLSRHDLTT